MKPHLFSVEEAEALLPDLSSRVTAIMHLHQGIKRTTQEITELFDIWGERVYELSNPDNKFYNERLQERANLLEELQHQIEAIRATGGVVKDLTIGLVDFYHEQDGELIFLCWKHGEDRIRYWHGIHEGYSTRKPLGAVAAQQ